MQPSQDAFLLAEFGALRREIEISIKEERELLRYALLSSGAIWAWLLSQHQERVSLVASFVPGVLTALLFGQVTVEKRSIYRIAGYIAAIERAFGLPEQFGWETRLFNERARGMRLPRWPSFTWLLLSLFNVVGAVLTILFR